MTFTAGQKRRPQRRNLARKAAPEQPFVVPHATVPPQPALQLIYDTAPIGLAFLSTDCRYLQINQRLTEICGISVQDHLGRSVRDCVPALATSVENIVRSIVETGDPVTGIEVAGQRADQTDERWWVTYWHPLRGPGGDILGVNVAAEEITERKRSEQEIHRAKETAEAALQDLRATQTSLIEAEKHAALGRLIAGVAHEINNPVGSSLTVASSLQHRTDVFAAEVAHGDVKRSHLNDFIEATREASEQLIANLNRVAELIQSFKEVAADRNRPDRRNFDLGDITARVLVTLRPSLRKRNVGLVVECQPGLVLNSYPGPFGQVLTNLFLNSLVHAYPDGRDGTIEIKVRARDADHVDVTFADDGCGMTEAVKRQAFDPFYTTRRDEGATGLGLHIVYNIVTHRLGGKVTLESAPGQGTRYQLILPKVAPL